MKLCPICNDEMDFECNCGDFFCEECDTVECDFCGEKHCKGCLEDAKNIGGGLNYDGEGGNCCYGCAEFSL